MSKLKTDEMRMNMEETFNITVEMLKVKGACASGMRDFLKEFPREQYLDSADYQKILNACAAAECMDYAAWLLNHFGATNTTLNLEEIDTDGFVVFAGSIVVGGCIKCHGIKAGRGIETGRGIKAGRGIEAGWGIKAGEGIKAGNDFGIYAGMDVCLSGQERCAAITARKKPANIMCGVWKEKQE